MLRVAGCLALAGAIGGMACAKATYLELQFTGTGLPEIRAIALDLTLMSPDAAAVRSSDVVTKDDSRSPITLPASMALRLDSESGTLTVAATAVGAENQEVAKASKSTTVMHGQTWTMVLNLSAATSALTATSPTQPQEHGPTDAGGN